MILDFSHFKNRLMFLANCLHFLEIFFYYSTILVLISAVWQLSSVIPKNLFDLLQFLIGNIISLFSTNNILGFLCFFVQSLNFWMPFVILLDLIHSIIFAMSCENMYCLYIYFIFKPIIYSFSKMIASLITYIKQIR